MFAQNSGDLDQSLQESIKEAGFAGRIESTLKQRLGRPLNSDLAGLGRMLWFDKIHSLHVDNSCGGCHSPTNAFGDSQSIAIGVQNNNKVGPKRTGPRNQRRTPSVINSASFPALMWNGRFFAPSGNPFNKVRGFAFPAPEGTTTFRAKDPIIKHLLIAQAHIPPTELVEVAGFTGTKGTLGIDFDQFDDGLGHSAPPPDSSGFRNEPIRQKVLTILNGSSMYRKLFGALFPEVRAGGPIDFSMFGRAIAEFEFFLTFANAPIDRYARGETNALTGDEKRGALLFFGKAQCVKCHSVAGNSNEMFSDFKNRNIGVPQIAPQFGVAKGNMIFDGPNQDEDFGAEQISGKKVDRYKFRTSPLRNVSLQPAFFHNGAYTRLEDAIRHHLDIVESATCYNPTTAGVDADLRLRVANPTKMLETIDPILKNPIQLSQQEFAHLVKFVRNGLTDPRARPEILCALVPLSLPSGLPPMAFEGCR